MAMKKQNTIIGQSPTNFLCSGKLTPMKLRAAKLITDLPKIAQTVATTININLNSELLIWKNFRTWRMIRAMNIGHMQ